MSADEILVFIIDLFTRYLDELCSLEKSPFIHGEMTAYVETLEIIQKWKFSSSHGLSFDIEDTYPV